MRRIIMKAFWMFITAAPSLVIRLGVEKRSMLEKEKVWMASYWSCLRLPMWRISRYTASAICEASHIVSP